METANITYQDEAGNIKVKIDYDKCITCGRCVIACKHEARYYVDDTERFFDDLSKGVPISLMIAPSVRTNIPEYKRLFTYLKRLGVKKIYDAALGADICTWAHVRYMEKNNFALYDSICEHKRQYCRHYSVYREVKRVQ
ncbi:MAG: 4Fe-4S binding protein [Planctomycetaceae bacterium]|nr:4Fe-4S binding protein [Planctomycetaceae bacterium]